MTEAKVYRVTHQNYAFMVRFRRRGFPSYTRYFVSEEDAQADCQAFNQKLFEEGRQGISIGPRERLALESFLLVCKARDLTIAQATQIIEAQKPEGGQSCEAALISLLTLRERQGRSPRTLNQIRNECRAFFRHCGVSDLARIDPLDCEDWIFLARRPDSQRARYAALSNLFNHSQKKGWLTDSPLAGLERPRKGRPLGAVVFTANEAGAFLRALEAWRGGVLVSYYCLLIFAGLRPSEALALEPDDVRAKSIRITGGKRAGRARRTVPISATLRAWLDAYEHLPLLPAGLTENAPLLRSSRELSPRVWAADICRHTYASMRLALVHNENQVAREMGTRPDTIYNHYYEIMEPADAERFDRIRPGPVK